MLTAVYPSYYDTSLKLFTAYSTPAVYDSYPEVTDFLKPLSILLVCCVLFYTLRVADGPFVFQLFTLTLDLT